MPDADRIRRVLDDIKDPCSVAQSIPTGLDEMGIVKSVQVSDAGCVEIELRLTSPFCEMLPFMQGEARRCVGELEGVTEVRVSHDAGLDWDHDLMSPAAQARRQRRLRVLRERALAERRA